MYRKTLAVLVTCVLMFSGLTALTGAAPSSGGPALSGPSGRGTTPNNDSEDNNNFVNATLITGNANFGGGCGGGDSWDYYKIALVTAPTPGGNADNLAVTLVLNIGMTWVKIFDPNHYELLTDGPGLPGSTLKLNFTAYMSGFYFIQLKDFGPCNYTITTLITQKAFTSDGNDETVNATNIETAGYPYQKVDTLDNVSDIQDWFKVHLNYTATVSQEVIKVSLIVPPLPTTCDFGLEVYLLGNITPQAMAVGNPAGYNETLTFSYQLASDFYIRVWGPLGSGQYTLKVKKFAGYSDQNEQMANAAELVKTAPHWYNTTGNLSFGMDQDDFYQMSNVLKGQTFNGTLNSTNYDAADRTPVIRIGMINDTGIDVPPDPADNLADPTAEANARTTEDGKMYIQLNLTEWAGAYTLSVRTNAPPQIDNEIANISFPENTTNTTIKLSQVFSDPEGDPLTFAYDFFGPIDGNMTVVIGTDANKTVTLTPKPGWRGSGYMEITATDPDGESATVTVLSISVFGINHKPVVANPNPDKVWMTKNKPDSISLDMYSIFSDPDSDKLKFFVTGNTSLRVTFPLEVQNNYWPTGEVMIVPNTGFVGVELLTFTCADEGVPPMASDAVTVEVEVREDLTEKVNLKDIPKLTFPMDTTNSAVNLNEYMNTTMATDPITFVNVPANGSHLPVTIGIDGRVTLKPEAGWWGTEMLRFRGTCTHNLSANLTMAVEVTFVNDVPKIVTWAPVDAIVSISEGQSMLFRVNATDLLANTTPLKYNWTKDGAKVGSNFDFNFVTDFETVTGGAPSKTFLIKVTVNDSALQTSRNWTITVNNVNRVPSKPQIVSPPNAATYEKGAKVSFSAVSTDDDGDNLTYTWTEKTKTLGTGAVFNTTKLGEGKHNITCTVTDGMNSTTAYVVITIKPKPSPGFEGLVLMAAMATVLVMAAAFRRRRN